MRTKRNVPAFSQPAYCNGKHGARQAGRGAPTGSAQSADASKPRPHQDRRMLQERATLGPWGIQTVNDVRPASLEA